MYTVCEEDGNTASKKGRQETVPGLGLIGMLNRKMVLFKITI
jgi:hypothetical protein